VTQPCARIGLIDVTLGIILGRLILAMFEALWLAWRERHSDGADA
jgi:hypothetical protein